jgi:hypothetical protein
MEKDPARRIHNAGDLKQALGLCRMTMGMAPAPPAAPARDPLDVVAEMTRPRSATPSDRMLHCGLGFWLTPDGAVELEGYDAGVSFRSTHDPADRRTRTVVSNWSDGAWPICRALEG